MKTTRPQKQRFFLRVENFEVEINTDVAEYARLVRFYLPSHVLTKHGQTAPAMRIDACRRRPETSEDPWGKDLGFLSELRRYGLAWRADMPRRCATVAIDDRKRLPVGLLYHGGFLFPLSLLLLPFRAALIHGGLISDGKRAVLVIGTSGVGKSTLAVSFNSAGFFCFTDEHALLRRGRGGVHGGRFLSRVALPVLSMRNFKDQKTLFSWESSIGKYFLKPAAQNLPVAACRIDKIVFPRFALSGPRRIHRLRPSEVFKRLLCDDYYYHSSSHLESYGRDHLNLFTDLAGSAAGYSLRYTPNDVRRIPELIGQL